MRQRRAFLLDACCVIAGSHNPRACRLFARAFEARGFVARFVIPRHGEAAFPGGDAAALRVLPYPYAQLYGTVAGSPHHPIDRRLHVLLGRHRGDGRQRLANRLRLPFADRQIARLFAPALATELDRLALGHGDLVALPTADLYATDGLLAWLAGRPPSEAPAVLLRFLNLLESHGLHRPYDRLKALLQRAAALRRHGHRIVLAAEVEPWAAKLERRSGLPALLLPTPPEPVASRPRDPDRLGVSLLSLRRGEQGSRRLLPILRALPPAARVRLDIVAQAPRRGVRSALQAQGARVLDSDLSDLELSAALSTLDVTLLPYLAERYGTRGSSMLFEAANHGHFVLASAGCGFSAEVETFGLGRLCVTDDDFAGGLVSLLDEPGLRARSQAAAQRYNAYRERQVDLALGALEL